MAGYIPVGITLGYLTTIAVQSIYNVLRADQVQIVDGIRKTNFRFSRRRSDYARYRSKEFLVIRQFF